MLQRVGRPQSEAGDESDIVKRIQVFQDRIAEVERHLKVAEGYFKDVVNPGKTPADYMSQINGDGSVEEVHGEVTQAAKEFTQHVEGRA